MPTYLVTVGDRTISVAIRRAGDQTFAKIGDDQEQPVSLKTVEGALHLLTLGARRTQALAVRTGDGVEVALDGLQYRVEVQDEARVRLARLAGASTGGPTRRELKAPMPGLVVKVLCQPGDQVARGQPLVVLQAMKMENELSLPHEGTVKSVTAEPGKTVDQGQVLVVLE